MEGITTIIEIPLSIEQQSIWNLENQLKIIDGVKVDFRESKDLISTTLLILQITASAAGTIAATTGGIKGAYDVAKILYDFLHKPSKKQGDAEPKKNIHIIKKGIKVEIYDLSLKELEHILKEHDEIIR